MTVRTNYIFALLFFGIFFNIPTNAQVDSTLKVAPVKIVNDTNYYKTYDDYIVGRYYFSRKYTSMLIDFKDEFKVQYIPNSTLNMGIGATYKFVTLNIGIGFAFLNPDEGKGDTKYLDLQFHSYGRKLMVDVFGQFYNGFYLDPKGKATTPDQYYVRPDMSLTELGVTAQYIFNHKRFSYRSSFTQNEWQKKSAGSLLAGAEVFYGDSRFDSTAIPTALSPENAANNYTRMFFSELGINGGYAYTVVVKKHYFLHGSLSISLDYGQTQYKGDYNNIDIAGFGSNSIFRIATGYNSERWVLNFLFTNNRVNFYTDDKNKEVAFNTGNYRIIFAWRFLPGEKLKKKLNIIDRI